MKIAIVANTAQRAILEHIHDGTLDMSDDIEGVMVEDCLTSVPQGLPVINTCTGAIVLEQDEELRAAFHEEVGIVPGIPDSFLYGFISPTGVSDFMEMSVCDRLMVGGVGPKCGLVQGCAVPCSSDVYDAFPDLAVLIDALHQIQYCGEISIGISRNFKICTVMFGHCTGAFALFTELAAQNPQSTLEFAFGKRDICRLHETRISIATLFSYPPYPHANDTPFSIVAPRQAERHLFRFQVGASELAYASSSGDRLYEARRRLRRTMDACSKYNDSLQYRTDAGKFRRFVFSQERYRDRGGHV